MASRFTLIAGSMDSGCHDCDDVDEKGGPNLLSEERVAKRLKPTASAAAAAAAAASTNHRFALIAGIMDSGCHDCDDVDEKGGPNLLSEERVAKRLKPIEAAALAAAKSTNHPVVPLLYPQQTATPITHQQQSNTAPLHLPKNTTKMSKPEQGSEQGSCTICLYDYTDHHVGMRTDAKSPFHGARPGYCLDCFIRYKLYHPSERSKLSMLQDGTFHFFGRDQWSKGILVPADIVKVIFDQSVTRTGSFTFANCTSLRHVTLNDGLKYIKQGSFEKCFSLEVINIPSTLTRIGKMTFQGCSKLKYVFLANVQLNTIHPATFRDCSSLVSIKLPPTVRAIQKGAFSRCIKLEEIFLHEGLTKVDDRAFSSCSSLKSIMLPSTIKELGKYVFCNCINLNEVALNEGLKVIDCSLFNKCQALIHITLPSTIVEIRESAFDACTSLKEIVLNEGLTDTSFNVFKDCIALERISIPSTLDEASPNGMFQGCTSLREVTVNDTLEFDEEYRGFVRFGLDFEPSDALECIKFQAITRRMNGINKNHQAKVKDRIIRDPHIEPYIEWSQGECKSNPQFWTNVDHYSGIWRIFSSGVAEVLACLSYYEMKETATTIELMFWKARIKETGAETRGEREECRCELPQDATAIILQCAGHDNAEDYLWELEQQRRGLER
jgi:hypothetical protein